MTNYTAFDFIVSSVTGPSNRNLIITSIAKNKLSQGGVNIVEGDSGGPGFIWENGVPFLISINSVAGSNTVVSIPANHEAVTAVTKSQWFPNRSTNSIGIDRAEINANVWRLGPQLDQVLWALAQRSATDLCRRRNMAGGHYEGTQQGSTVSLQCSKKANVAYFDADPTNDAAVPSYWRFPNIDTVPWATANRAAERICASKGKGFAGGHFNGNQSGNAKGLFCFSNAQYVESKVENPNQHMNLDTVSWAAAARFAKGYCNREGAASGFPNGHQITKGTIQFKGLVCFR